MASQNRVLIWDYAEVAIREPGSNGTRIINWVLGVTGFVGFLVGLAMLAYVSMETVTVSPNSSLRDFRVGVIFD